MIGSRPGHNDRMVTVLVEFFGPAQLFGRPPGSPGPSSDEHDGVRVERLKQCIHDVAAMANLDVRRDAQPVRERPDIARQHFRIGRRFVQRQRVRHRSHVENPDAGAQIPREQTRLAKRRERRPD